MSHQTTDLTQRYSACAYEHDIEIRPDLETQYADVFTPAARAALAALASFDSERRTLMEARTRRRAQRAQRKERIAFLGPNALIPRTQVTVRDAREGRFIGEIS
jgi:malate synthase